MFAKLFSTDTKPGAFFRPIDWTAFWGATLATFLVYFFTLGPSVGLEDSGELATAADHLGVPHPPGYPFWSLCSWIFCRLFSWVTYMGQPTPAWAVSLFSAVAGAFAAGCTAMLICRSGSDMLDSLPASGDADAAASTRLHARLALAGGLGGSLVFAFSPVEWSQATIVEIYSLNALFLMAVFLLSYRWMRKPSDKILWLTAFVFGLGLTNYQVLLLAALPLAIIILLKNVRLFRDFMLLLIPVGLTAEILSVGCKLRANQYMSADVINKFEPLVQGSLFPEGFTCPNEFLLWTGFALVALAPVAAVLARRAANSVDSARKTAFSCGGAGLGLVFLSATVCASTTTWSGPLESAVAPLLPPVKYAILGVLLAGSFTAALGAVFAPADRAGRPRTAPYLVAAGLLGALAVVYALSVTGYEFDSARRAIGETAWAGSAGYRGEPFSWASSTLHLVLALAVLFALALTCPRGLAYAIPVAAVQLAAFILLKKGAMNGLTNPHSWWFFWPIVWNFLILALAGVTLPNGRAASFGMLFAELGVSFYVYMPIVSDLRNPPMNWGYPRTWEGFKHAIMRGQYEAIKMPDFFSADGFALFLKQMGFYFQDLRMQFTLVAAALALLPFSLWNLVVRGKDGAVRRFGAAGVAAALYVAVAALVAVFSELCEGLNGGEVPLRLDKLLLLLMAVLVLAGGAAIVCRQALVVFNMLRGRATPAADDAPRARFALRFGPDDVSQQWLIALGACFGIMSLFLVALAGVKGDIQDGFIQKVKFISSHGIFAVWIGYGLLVGAAIAVKLAARFRLASKPFVALVMLLAASAALIPVYENYTNDKLVFAMGSAEQNGHTFGWQFGNYQLRGANAIREELHADEEPLPNPQWPEEMEPRAIFFGGTDPGRFVPTYMIYSANVRPDVYLITQNALADDTYMSVERDLYGDEIWIPSKEDSAESFSIYVNEVQSGKRPANAALKIENGRVQVTGALGVMEINGVLTKMMFDHERLRHAFYVEESYVIQWMYDYLAPHGLIMKICKDPNPLRDAKIAVEDGEFWDWYHRRLLRDPAFRRDFPAQKSFSKLRAAIAGLYRSRGRYREADVAFREACLLYPASPEASFRYIQEVLMPMKRWNAILDILDYTDRVDPNNGRTRDMRAYVQRLHGVTDEIQRLQQKQTTGKLTLQETFLLAQDYASVGQNGAALGTVKRALAMPGAEQSFDTLFMGARLYAQCGQRGDAAATMAKAAKRTPPNADPRLAREMADVLAAGGLNAEAAEQFGAYLRAQPQDVEAWLKFAIVKHALGAVNDCYNAIRRAYQINPQIAADRLQASEQLQKIAAPLFQRQP